MKDYITLLGQVADFETRLAEADRNRRLGHPVTKDVRDGFEAQRKDLLQILQTAWEDLESYSRKERDALAKAFNRVSDSHSTIELLDYQMTIEEVVEAEAYRKERERILAEADRLHLAVHGKRR